MNAEKINNMNEQIVKNEAYDSDLFENTESKTKFYNKGWWAILWCLLFWPIGLFMIWRFYGNQKKEALPRTVTIDKPLEDL